ncbi:MAG: hypothetical protein AAGE93_05405 [Bacteroidota bacterium]
MKIASILSLALCLVTLMLGCQPEDIAPLIPKRERPIDDLLAIPSSTSIPPNEIVRTKYSGATRWRITFTNPNPLLPHSMNYQRFFDTQTGATLSLSDMNANAEATAQADMNFLYGSLKATTEYQGTPYPSHPEIQLQYPEAVRDTQFVPTNLSLAELNAMTIMYPEQFQTAYENSSLSPTSYQPYNYKEDGYEPPSYQTGEIYLFKTDRSPIRYGAIRIVEKTSTNLNDSQYIVEITVQSNNGFIQR